MDYRPLLLIAPALLAAGCVTNFSVDETGEMEEPNGLRLEDLGQKTCVEAARHGEASAACPRVPTRFEAPQTGIEILDSFFAVYGSPPPLGDEVEQAFAFVSGESAQPPTGALGSLKRGTNPSRASGGAIGDVIAPGGGFFIALWGKWDNVNGDAMVDVRYVDPQSFSHAMDNEWAIDITGDPLLGYVEPGSHPTLLSASRFQEDMPDFVYKAQADVFVSSGDAAQSEVPVTSHILFTDGSLFRHVRVTTVSRPLLAPDPDGRFPFTPRPGSLVDIDDYSALAPGPVAALYGVLLGEAVESVGSPNLGICPRRCAPDPAILADTPLAPVAREGWSPYPQEWRVDSGSSRAGRWEEHKAAYAPWIDLLALARVNPTGGVASQLESRDGPLMGRRADGAQTSAPGLVTFEAWTGLWRDLDADGFVGRAGDEPYGQGARPQPDDYYASGGEYLSLRPLQEFTVTLTPHDTWGDGVIVVAGYPGSVLAETPWPVVAILASLERGASDPIVLPMRYAHAEDGVFPGHYLTPYSVLLPAGSPGFDVCTETLPLRYEVGGDAGETVLYDCDVIAPWEGAP